MEAKDLTLVVVENVFILSDFQENCSQVWTELLLFLTKLLLFPKIMKIILILNHHIIEHNFENWTTSDL